MNEPRKVQWPLVDADGNLYLSKEWRADECLTFFPDGHIESNGGRVEHHEISHEEIEMLSEADQQFVMEFLS